MSRRDVDFGEAAEHILFFFHINPEHHWSQQVFNAADKMSDPSIAMIVGNRALLMPSCDSWKAMACGDSGPGPSGWQLFPDASTFLSKSTS